MKGTEKQISWAADIKSAAIDALNKLISVEIGTDGRMGIPAERQAVIRSAAANALDNDDAGFWIDTRDANLGGFDHLVKILESQGRIDFLKTNNVAGTTPADVVCSRHGSLQQYVGKVLD